MDYAQAFKKMLDATIAARASDLLISVGHPATVRVTGQLVPLAGEKLITSADAQGLAFSLLNEAKKHTLLVEKELDFSYDFEGKARFRVNIFFQREEISIALRLILPNIKTIEDLFLPPVLHDFVKKNQGLVLVTGASGQGKSTTLAALIDEINHTRAAHIV